MFEIETLKKLKENSSEVNEYLKEINSLIDNQMPNVEGMCDISQRIKKAFTLYKTLVIEMENQSKNDTYTKD